MTHITRHAVLRYQERVEPCTKAEARAAMREASRGIDKAAEFGCGTIIMGNGARLRLKGDTVTTVLEKRRH